MSDSPLQRLARLALDEDPGQWSAHQRNERYTWQSTAANNVWAPGVYGWKSA